MRDNEKNVQTNDYVGTNHLSLRQKNVGQAQTIKSKLFYRYKIKAQGTRLGACGEMLNFPKY
ncbi:Uncharacterised protein [Mycobacteroides abscessus subsp. abscessus]|nr:Uncharacterised protein [Mycobacteroides abscessus subsp. abscessus]